MMNNKKDTPVREKTFFNKIIAFISILISIIYILNPTLGVFELIPDNLPFIGNLDEAGAVYVIITGLRYLGIDITNFFKH